MSKAKLARRERLIAAVDPDPQHLPQSKYSLIKVECNYAGQADSQAREGRETGDMRCWWEKRQYRRNEGSTGNATIECFSTLFCSLAATRRSVQGKGGSFARPSSSESSRARRASEEMTTKDVGSTWPFNRSCTAVVLRTKSKPNEWQRRMAAQRTECRAEFCRRSVTPSKRKFKRSK